MSAPALSVVIPTLGRRTTLRRACEHLAAQRDAPPFELLLVADPGGGAHAVEAAEAARAGLDLPARVLQAGRPGASAARNVGWRAAQAPVVVFLDDDVLPDPGLLAAHASAHAADPSPGRGVLGTMRWADGLPVTAFMRWIEHGWQFDFAALGGVAETGWWHLYTCNASVKRAALEAVGGFDELRFPFGYEDLELGRRLDATLPGGFRLAHRADASAGHDHPMTLEQWRDRVRRIARSERAYVAAYPGTSPWWHDRLVQAGAPDRWRWAARLAEHVGPDVPVLGPAIWRRAKAWWGAQLAEPFLRAWTAV